MLHVSDYLKDQEKTREQKNFSVENSEAFIHLCGVALYRAEGGNLGKNNGENNFWRRSYPPWNGFISHQTGKRASSTQKCQLGGDM